MFGGWLTAILERLGMGAGVPSSPPPPPPPTFINRVVFTLPVCARRTVAGTVCTRAEFPGSIVTRRTFGG